MRIPAIRLVLSRVIQRVLPPVTQGVIHLVMSRVIHPLPPSKNSEMV